MNWVVFDFGKVISRPTAALPRLAAMLGADPAGFRTAYFAERDRYDRGCGELPYWRAVGDRLGTPVDEALAAELTTVDNAGWLDTDPDSLQLIEELNERRVPLAVLSNASASFGRAVERQPWARAFRHLVFSADLLMAKPDAEIYEHLLRTIGAPAGECTFLDDRQDNVTAAQQLGMHAHVWRGADEARELLLS